VAIFDVLSLRLLDTEILERSWASETSEDDFTGLEGCAALLAHYDVLGDKVKCVKVQYGDEAIEDRIPKRPPSEEHLALWSAYSWYRPASSS
jgi:hypothetical protein